MEQFREITQEEIQAEQTRYITRVYAWMGFALMITGFFAMLVAQNVALLSFIFGNQIVFWGLVIGEILLVGYLSAAVSRMRAITAIGVFIFYAALNGVTLSAIFILYSASSIASTFFVTAATFGIMSAFGYFTKKDLTSIGNMLYMALIGLVVATIVNVIFFKNEMFHWITTYIGILIFVGLIAYDTQKIKEMNVIGNEGTEEDKKEAVMGALTLYLDFINLFLLLLRVFGRSRD